MFDCTLHRRCLIVLALAGLMLQSFPAVSQEKNPPAVHWAYASYFGTGWYKINNEQHAFIAHFSPTWLSGQAEWLRDAAYRIRVPITVGVTHLDFDDVSGIFDPDNFSTASIGLSADIDVPLTERLSVRPNVQFSYGTVIGENSDAYTYRGDVRWRYRFDPGKLEWAIVGSAGVVAYESNDTPDDSFTYGSLGAELTYPISWFSSDDNQTLLHWHVVYTDIFNHIKTQTRAGEYATTTNYWRAGFAFGKKGRDIKLWFLRFDRVGLAYDISPSGDLRGVNLVFQSLYEP